MLDSVLVALGLRRPLADRCADVQRSVSPLLLKAAEAIELGLYGHVGEAANRRSDGSDAKGYTALGWYSTHYDVAHVNVPNVVHCKACVNDVLAHELIHATGHAWRLNRGHVGKLSTGEDTLLPTKAEHDSEEVIAQYGAMLLLRKLGVRSSRIEEVTARYLQRHGRKDGKPTASEAIHAVRAVKYIINQLGDTYAEQ